ncbi:MAG: VWA containing CoxE family protein, partial [Gammaproteobacteria bacterium]
MERTVTDFVRVLRNADVRVSPAETLDAVRALALVGYAGRERLREVLSATLAKTIDEKATLDACFERFFTWREAAEETASGSGESGATDSGMSSEAAASNGSLGGAYSGELSELSQLLLSGDATRLQFAIDAAGRASGIEGMRLFTQRGLYGRR